MDGQLTKKVNGLLKEKKLVLISSKTIIKQKVRNLNLKKHEIARIKIKLKYNKIKLKYNKIIKSIKK